MSEHVYTSTPAKMVALTHAKRVDFRMASPLRESHGHVQVRPLKDGLVEIWVSESSLNAIGRPGHRRTSHTTSMSVVMRKVDWDFLCSMTHPAEEPPAKSARVRPPAEDA